MTGASPNHSPKPGVSSPWSQIVAAAAPPSSPPLPVDSALINFAPADDFDNGGGNNVNTGKRPAWNKPSNGASSSVMDADSWPALSESARATAVKSPSPLESDKGSVDAMSTPSLQVFFFSSIFSFQFWIIKLKKKYKICGQCSLLIFCSNIQSCLVFVVFSLYCTN